MAAVELTLLGQRLEESARRHRMAIGATTSTSASNGSIGVEVTAERGAANNENVHSFGATIETHMERSRRSLLHDEMVSAPSSSIFSISNNKSCSKHNNRNNAELICSGSLTKPNTCKKKFRLRMREKTTNRMTNRSNKRRKMQSRLRSNNLRELYDSSCASLSAFTVVHLRSVGATSTTRSADTFICAVSVLSLR
ncbi:hypothetical protein niasHT_012441 [Heterodera trifolii]|uniref:Uncharacterized protein n=1 Tax=Heterodera trifolii TaxID=157864 RepID=A0ABD2L3D0_9BILA